MLVNFRKPLVVFTPKSLLRHPKCVSSVADFTEGGFQEVIDDQSVIRDEVKTLVFCTGKFYYDLLATREELNRKDVALVRVEQLFPLPVAQMQAVMEKYSHVTDMVWAQEEPRNMGAWGHLMMHFPDANRLRVAARRIYASPAAGSPARSKMRHQQVIDYVFDITKDNTKRPSSATANSQ
jgi:2-oxoglutarate dehydrogenase E1 component